MSKSTMKDIQRETGLSLGTISNYLNGKIIKAQNAEKIDEAITKLNYRVNSFARGLKTSESRLIGLILPNYDVLLFNKIVQEVENRLQKDNYSLIVSSCHENPEIECQLVDMMILRNIDGLIVVPTNTDPNFLKPAINSDTPIIIFDRMISNQFDTVLIDNESAVFEATNTLLSYGHQNIGIICGPKQHYTAKMRLKGYKKALAKRNVAINPDYIFYGNYHVKSGKDGMDYFSRIKDISAIICTNGDMSTGAIIKLNKHREMFHRNINLVIFDYLELSEAYKDGMPVIVQPTEDIAKIIYDLLIARLQNTEQTAETHLVKTSIENKHLFRCP